MASASKLQESAVLPALKACRPRHSRTKGRGTEPLKGFCHAQVLVCASYQASVAGGIAWLQGGGAGVTSLAERLAPLTLYTVGKAAGVISRWQHCMAFVSSGGRQEGWLRLAHGWSSWWAAGCCS